VPTTADAVKTQFPGAESLIDVVIAAKVKFGVMKLTKANWIMVDEFIRRHMTGLKIRPSHIAKMHTKLTSTYFIPTLDDIEGANILANADNVERYTAYHSPTTTWWQWLTGAPSRIPIGNV